MNESMKKENNKEGLYSPKGKVSLGQAVPMALQHVVAMVVGCISNAGRRCGRNLWQ